MKKTVKQVFFVCLLVVAEVMIPVDLKAQGFLKNLTQKAKEVVNANAANKQSTEATTTPELSDSVKAIRTLLLEMPEFTVNKEILTDENGKAIVNDDGSERYYYIIRDDKGNAWDAATVNGVIATRRKLYGNILKKAGIGALTGGLAGLAKGDVKSVAIGAGAGALAGLGLSIADIKQIRKINKGLKKLDDRLEEYQRNITDEGLPKAANPDYAAIDKALGIEGDAVQKAFAEVMQEIETNKSSKEVKLDEIDMSALD